MKLFIDKLFSLAGEKKLIAKMISIFLALVLWGYIYDSKTGRIKFEAQIEYVNLPAQLIVTNPSIKTLTVNIDGRKDYIKNIDIKTLTPVVNLINPKIDEEWVYQIGINRQQIPDSINISLSTDKVRLIVERQAQKRVRIMPVLKGELPDGYVAGRIKTIPDSVVITGARSLLEKISYINTDPIILDNVSTDISREADLRPDHGADITLSESIVKVNVTIFKMGELYSIDVPVVIKNYSHEFTHHTDIESVRVFLRKTDKPGIKPGEIDISVNAGTIEKTIKKEKTTKTETVFPVNLIVKQQYRDAEIINYSPDTVKITTEYNEPKQDRDE